jgi:hypothetical protein
MLRKFLRRNDLGYAAKVVLILLIMFCSASLTVGTVWNCIFD